MLNDSVIDALKAVPAAPEMFTKTVTIDVPKGMEAFVEKKVAKPKAVKAKAPKAPKKAKEPRITKQAQANEIVAKLLKGKTLTKDLKKQAIADIQNFVGMSKAGATTYFYNAMKAL